jgi:hypothetical protein
MRKRGALHRRSLHLHAASCGPVGLRHDERDVMARDYGFERRHRELGRSTKDKLQAFTL